MIVSMDTFNSTIQMTPRKLEKISQTLFSFTGLCNYRIDFNTLSKISQYGGVVSLFFFSIFLFLTNLK